MLLVLWMLSFAVLFLVSASVTFPRSSLIGCFYEKALRALRAFYSGLMLTIERFCLLCKSRMFCSISLGLSGDVYCTLTLRSKSFVNFYSALMIFAISAADVGLLGI